MTAPSKFHFNPTATEFVPAPTTTTPAAPKPATHPVPAGPAADHGQGLYYGTTAFAGPVFFSPVPLSALHSVEFEALLTEARRSAENDAWNAADATNEVMTAKLATGCCAFLTSLGYEPAVVVRAITVREYLDNPKKPRAKQVLERAKAQIEAAAARRRSEESYYYGPQGY